MVHGVSIATILVPDLFHAGMEIPGFDPLQTASAMFRVTGISRAASTLCVFGMRPFTSYKARNRDI